MFSNNEFKADTYNGKIWISLNQMKSRTEYTAGAPMVTRECNTVAELEQEVARLKEDLDAALMEARKKAPSN